MGFEIEKVDSARTVSITVLVQFQGQNGSVIQGDFKGEFKRLEQARVDDLIGKGGDENEEPYTNSEVVDEVLLGVSGITRNGTELPPDEQLAFVKASPECVGAAVAAFFETLRPARYAAKTSKKRRGRG